MIKTVGTRTGKGVMVYIWVLIRWEYCLRWNSDQADTQEKIRLNFHNFQMLEHFLFGKS